MIIHTMYDRKLVDLGQGLLSIAVAELADFVQFGISVDCIVNSNEVN